MSSPTVYEIGPVTLAALDRLEGHPRFYQRTAIRLEGGDCTTATPPSITTGTSATRSPSGTPGFGTLCRPRGRPELTLGLDAAEQRELGSVAALYLLPFVKAWRLLRARIAKRTPSTASPIETSPANRT